LRCFPMASFRIPLPINLSMLSWADRCVTCKSFAA
jgi:hypothetical protein